MLVIDEADEMLNKGFKEQIYDIYRYLPPSTQVVLISATMPQEVLDMTKKFMNMPVKILVKRDELTLEGIKQVSVFFFPKAISDYAGREMFAFGTLGLHSIIVGIPPRRWYSLFVRQLLTLKYQENVFCLRQQGLYLPARGHQPGHFTFIDNHQHLTSSFE